jgi:filamentous hemagglutinin family protein
MNKTYRLVWNELTNAWVAVSEIVKAHGKRSTKILLLTTALAVLPAPTFAAPPNPPATTALPTGGQLVAGQATIAPPSNNTLTITQTSQRAAIDWQTFNVGSSATVNFNQPSSSAATLNRVLDPNPSQIFGRINANGQIFLTNPSGIYFGKSASVNVGSFAATTHSIGNDDFMAGKLNFTRNGATGKVENEGNLTADLNGYIALLAPEVRNNGVVIAQGGTVALAAGEAFELQFDNGRMTNVRVEPATIAALVENGNAVQAPGGFIILSAQAANRLQGGVVNNTGSLEAAGLVDNGGTIRLLASDRISHSGSINVDAAPGKVGAGGTAIVLADLANLDSRTEVSGKISARGGDLGGDGGFIETSASHVDIQPSAEFNTLAPKGETGLWLIDPYDYTIDATAALNIASGLRTSNVAITTASSTPSYGSNGNSSSTGNITVNSAITAIGLSSIAVTGGGSGYSSAPVVTISGGGGTGATATATVSGGVVTGITITNSGSGYTSAPTISFSGGSGSGATANATLMSSAYNTNLSLTAAGTISVAANITAGSLTLTGGGSGNSSGTGIDFASTITTNGAQSYNGKVAISGSTALNSTSGGVSFSDTVNALAGVQLLTGSSSWTVPVNVTTINVWAIGAGGGGGGTIATDGNAAGGGGAGGVAYKSYTVVANQTLSYSTGAAGAGGSNGSNGSTGGTTTAVYNGSTITAYGGQGGYANATSTAAGGTASGGTTNVTGGSSIGKTSDTGGSGGGAIGGTAGNAGSSNGGDGGLSSNVAGLTSAVALLNLGIYAAYSVVSTSTGALVNYPSASYTGIGTGAGIGSGTTGTYANACNGGIATGFGSGGGGGGHYGGNGGNGFMGGGGGGAGGYTAIHTGGAGGQGAVVVQYSVGATGLTINAGSGNVSFANKVGDVANLVGLNITTTGNISFNNTVGTSTLTTSSGGTTTFAGNVAAAGVVNLTSNTLTVNGNINATAGNITVNTDALNFGASGRFQSTGALSIAPKTVSNTMGLGGATGTLQLPASYFSTNFVNGFSGITVGSASTSGKITSAAITPNDHLTLQNTTGGIELTGWLNASSNNLTLNSSGTITDTGSGYISATGLALLGGGSVTLDSTSNAITTLAANTGRVTLLESNGFTVGTIDSTVGVTATGPIDLATRAGDLAITQNISTSDTSSAAIVLNAGKDYGVGTTTGGNVTRSGSQTVTTGSGGRATIFTGSVSGSTNITSLIGSGSGRFRYNSDEASSGYDTVGAALGSGSYALYRERPTVSFTVANASMVYGDAAPSLPLNVSSGVNGDTVAQIFKTSPTLTIGGSKSSSGNWVVGGHSLSATGGTGRLGYNLGSITGLGTLTVTKRTVTLNGANMTKTYDGTTAMTGGSTGYGALSNLMSGDTVTITGSAVWSAAGAGSRTVNQGTTAITGTDSGNYQLSFVPGTGTINKATLTMTASDASKLIGQADPTFAYTLNGFVNGETVASAGVTGLSVSRTGGDTAAGTYTGVLVPTFATHANYQLNAVNGNFTIVPADKLLITLASSTKSYGDALPTLTAASAQYVTSAGNTLRTVTLTPTSGGHYTFNDGLGTTGSFDVVTAATSTSTVGNYAVTLANFTQSGSNFSTQNTQNANLAITQRLITLGAGTVSKVYDGTTAASGSIAISNKVGSDDVSLSGTGTFTTKDVGSANKAYTLSSLLLSGSMASNYYLGATTSFNASNGTVTARPITWSVDNASSTYGTTAVPGDGRLFNTIGGDAVVPTVTVYQQGTSTVVTPGTRTAAASYDQKVTGITGTDAGNYSLTTGTTGTLVINPKAIVFSAPSISKTYDGAAAYTTTAQNLTDAAAAAGVVSGDTLTGLTLAFNDKNAGTNKPVSASAATFNGSEAGNYSITYQTANVGTIDPLSISVSGAPTAANKTYDGLTDATVSGGTLTGVLGADAANVNLQKSGRFVDANAGTGKTVDLVYALSGSEAGNYVLSSTTGTTTADIAKASLTMTANNDAKLLTESDPTFTARYSGFVNGETDSVLSGVSISRTGSDTAAGTYTGVLVPTATSGNYTISFVNGNFTIAPAQALLIQMGNATKVYGDAIPDLSTGAVLTARYLASDGTTIHYVPITAMGSNVYAGDDSLGTTFSFTATTPATAASTVGNYALTTSGFSQAGGNFTSTMTADGVLSVTPRPVTVSVGGLSKVYDGNTSMAGMTLAVGNKVGSDDVTLGGTGAYLDKNAGTGKSYTVSHLALSGAAAGNYYLTGLSQSGADGVITQRTLNVTYGGVNKTYDGTTQASVTTSDDRVSGDVLTIERVAAFTDKNQGTGKTINISGVSLSGTESANYAVASTGSATADIARRTLTVSYSGDSKTYDGTTAASVSTSDDRVSGDTLSITRTAAFADKNAGINKTINVTGVSLSSGDDGDNYTVAATGSATANIGQKALTVTAPTLTRAYDGTSAQGSATGSATVGALGTGDSIGTLATLSYTDKNAGTGKTVVASAIGIVDSTSADMTGNYLVTYVDDNSSVITRKALTISGLTSADKVYDGTTTATVNGTAALQAAIAAGSGSASDGKAYTGDTVSLTGTVVGNFNDKDVADANTVAFTGLSLTGAEAGNYTLTQHANATHAITAKALTISGSTANDKTYDGLLIAAATPGTLSGFVGAETVLASVSGATYDDAHAGSRTVTIVFTLADGDSGGLGSNYSLANATASATINPKGLNASATITGADKVYDGTTTATGSTIAGTTTGAIHGDAVALDTSGMTLDFANAAIGTWHISASGNATLGAVTGGGNGAKDGLSPGNEVAGQAGDYVLVSQPVVAMVTKAITAPLSTFVPPPPPPPPVFLSTPASAPPPLTNSSSSAPGGAASGPTFVEIAGSPVSSPAPDSGISVSLEREPSVQQSGIVTVSIPREMTVAGSSFGFSLPPRISEAAGNMPVQITLIEGDPLPGWLSFDQETKRFIATRMPEGVLPIRLVVTIRGIRTTIVIAKRSE